jgi:hypothetical protein
MVSTLACDGGLCSLAHRVLPKRVVANRQSGRVRARARYRDDDGQVRRVAAIGSTQKTAEHNLKEPLVDLWLTTST